MDTINVNNDPQISQIPTEKRHYGRITLFFSLSLFLILSLYVFLLAPLYIYCANDVLYMYGVIPELLNVALSICDIAVFGIAYAVILYSLYRFSFKKTTRFLWIYLGMILYKNVVNLLMTFLTDGVPTGDGLTFDVLSSLAYIGLEILQAALVTLIAHCVLSTAKKREAIRSEAAAVIGKESEGVSEYLPFRRLVSMKNPLEKATILAALVPMLFRIVSRIVYDIGYGLPTDLVDLLWMILYYGMDIVCYGVIVYFVMLLLLSQLHASEKKLKSKVE